MIPFMQPVYATGFITIFIIHRVIKNVNLFAHFFNIIFLKILLLPFAPISSTRSATHTKRSTKPSASF